MANGKANANIVAVDYSEFTQQVLDAAAEEQRQRTRQNGAQARQATTTDGQYDGWAAEAGVDLPPFALDPTHVTRRLSDQEIKELSAIGAIRLSQMPLRATAFLLSANHADASGKEGIIAVYHTDEHGIPCDRPMLVSTSAWASMWSLPGDWSAAPRFLQQVSWFTPRAAGTTVRNGRTRYFGYTAVADLNVTDVTGTPRNLGEHRFFFDQPRMYGLVAPVADGHMAASIALEFLGKKQVLPMTPAQLQLVSATVAFRMGTPINVVMRSYLNLPVAVDSQRVVRDFLDPKLPAAQRMANYLALRTQIASVRRSDANGALPAPAQEEVAPAIQQAVFDNPEDAL